MGFHRAARLCPASNEHPIYRTHPDCWYLLPLLQVVPDSHQLRTWVADFRGGVLICIMLQLELGSANACPRWAESKVRQDHDMEGSGSA